MHQLIASYLFQTKNCPIWGIGNLSISTAAAEPDFSNKKIYAPVPNIDFEEKDAPSAGLTNFITLKIGCDESEAIAALDHFYDKLKNDITTISSARLENVGTFYIDSSGQLKFKQDELPPAFLQPVTANRVIHPNREHSILVGDKETTNTLMTEFFNEEPVIKDKWWIWAIVLACIGIATIFFYVIYNYSSSSFGNAMRQ